MGPGPGIDRRIPGLSGASRRSTRGSGAPRVDSGPALSAKTALVAAGRLCAADGGPPAGSRRGRRKAMTGYAETSLRSLAEPEAFWAEAAEAIDWERRWDRV